MFSPAISENTNFGRSELSASATDIDVSMSSEPISLQIYVHVKLLHIIVRFGLSGCKTLCDDLTVVQGRKKKLVKFS